MKKISLYLDTTIFNFAFAEDDLGKKEVTISFLENIFSLAENIYISDEVIREISRAPEPRKLFMEGLLKKISPLLLDISMEAMELAER